MRAVNVSVRHDDDFMIAQLVGIEIITPDTCAQRRNQRTYFLARQHFVETRALHIQNLAAQRQHGLIFAIAALLGRPPRRISFDDEEFSL